MKVRIVLLLLAVAEGTLTGTSVARADAGDEGPCEESVRSNEPVQAQLRKCVSEFVTEFKVYMQTGDAERAADASYAGQAVARLLIGEPGRRGVPAVDGLAQTDPALYERKLRGLNKLGRREADAVFDLGLTLQSAWDGRYLFQILHQVGKRQRYRAVPTSLLTELGSLSTSTRAMIDPFANASYFKAFSQLLGWWGVGAAVGEGIQRVNDPMIPKAPAMLLDLSLPQEAEAQAQEDRSADQRRSLSELAGGWSATAATRVGAARLVGIRGPLAVRAVAWLGLIAVSVYTDHEAREASSAVLDRAHERELTSKLRASLKGLAGAVDRGARRRELLLRAREVTAIAYRVAAYWESQVDPSGTSLDLDSRVVGPLEAIARVEGRPLKWEDADRSRLAAEVARGELAHTVEGLFLQLAAYFDAAGHKILSQYSQDVFYARAARGVWVKTVLRALRDGDLGPEEAEAQANDRARNGGGR